MSSAGVNYPASRGHQTRSVLFWHSHPDYLQLRPLFRGEFETRLNGRRGRSNYFCNILHFFVPMFGGLQSPFKPGPESGQRQDRWRPSLPKRCNIVHQKRLYHLTRPFNPSTGRPRDPPGGSGETVAGLQENGEQHGCFVRFAAVAGRRARRAYAGHCCPRTPPIWLIAGSRSHECLLFKRSCQWTRMSGLFWR